MADLFDRLVTRARGDRPRAISRAGSPVRVPPPAWDPPPASRGRRLPDQRDSTVAGASGPREAVTPPVSPVRPHPDVVRLPEPMPAPPASASRPAETTEPTVARAAGTAHQATAVERLQVVEVRHAPGRAVLGRPDPPRAGMPTPVPSAAAAPVPPVLSATAVAAPVPPDRPLEEPGGPLQIVVRPEAVPARPLPTPSPPTAATVPLGRTGEHASSPPTVHVHIGRVDVRGPERAYPDPPVSTPAATASVKVLSLGDYLRHHAPGGL